jgi:DNA processing protein
MRPGRAGGKPRAVFGTGVDVIDPKENSRLAEPILALGRGADLGVSFGHLRRDRKSFPSAIGLSAACRWACLCWRPRNIRAPALLRAAALEQNRDVFAGSGNVTNENSGGPNTPAEQGAKLAASWEDAWEDLPTEV